MSTRWTLSVTLILLLVATTAFAAVVDDPRAVSTDQDNETLFSGDDSENEIVIQFGDPDDLITGNRGIGFIGSSFGIGSSTAWTSDIEDTNLFLTLSQVLFLVR
jgi:hypothetical protein